MSRTLILFHGVVCLSQIAWCETDGAFTYNFESDSIVNVRSKRQPRMSQPSTTTAFQTSQSESTDNWLSKWEKRLKEAQKLGNAMYYEVSTLQLSEASFNEHYLDILAMLEMPNAKGNKSHPHLSKKISFEFPFYGYRMENITIGTGGFCYTGNEIRGWWGATQYIAPLMANFDTSLPNATVMYADNGTVFVVEWSRVQLRDDPNGNFTFQLSLHKNGDIWFVYKEVPVAVELISDAIYTRKLGISDEFQYPIWSNSTDQGGQIIGTTYESYRLDVDPAEVKSKTVVIFKALPTCIALTTCHACANAALKHFNCSWCQGKEEDGGSFCSDKDGLNRRPREWVLGNCKEQNRNLYCSVDEDKKEEQPEEVKATDAR